MLSIASYGLGLYIGQPEIVKDKITAIFMRANRAIYKWPLPLKTKNEFVCRKIGKKTPRQLIVEEGVKFMHRCINTQCPNKIFDELTFPRRNYLIWNVTHFLQKD